jgi:hypothetical protein
MKLIPRSSARRMVRIPFSWSGITPRAEHHRPQGTGPDRNVGASENVIFHQIPFKGIVVTRQFRPLRSEITKSVGSRDATVHQKVATGDEPALGPHQQRPNGTDLIGRTAPPDRAQFNHAPVPLSTRPSQFVLRQRREDDARTDRVDPAAVSSAPSNGAGDRVGVAVTLDMIAGTLAATQPEAAAIILGAARAYVAESPIVARLFGLIVTEALGEERARELRARGTDMDWDQAVAYTLTQTTQALDELQSGPQP